jgi:hypothetical protein
MAKHGSIDVDPSIETPGLARSEEEIDAAFHMWLDRGAHEKDDALPPCGSRAMITRR